jgi:hypothetical protein
MKVLFRCGCEGVVKDSATGDDPPTCREHGARIARVSVRPPSFVGTVSGPYATTRALAPASPVIGEARLVLKAPPQESTHG